ncbi:MAG: hypothetical protein KA175_00415 [Flavobacteriales bacterium]|nr:hypothetical protein [Flavobacteriales bacterium]MBP6696047.1 hypothetical protein [Flavobacteriales bacterium]
MRTIPLIALGFSILPWTSCAGPENNDPATTQEQPNGGTPKDTAAAQHQHDGDHEVGYACPMHPEVTGNKGDTCPKCGMDLEEQK